MDNIYERSLGLLGQEAFDKIQKKHIVIFGIGGVGSSALETLARTGFKRISIVDFDNVSASNLNRQILYSASDIGKSKVEIAKNYIENITKEIFIDTYCCKAQDYNFENDIDFVIDAIDDIDGKLYIAKSCLEKHIPFIVSLGMANRFDPSKVYITTLNKTFNDPLAKKIRYIYKQNSLSLSQINVVSSAEEPVKFEGKLNSIMTVPCSAGLNIAYYVIKHFLKEE